MLTPSLPPVTRGPGPLSVTTRGPGGWPAPSPPQMLPALIHTPLWAALRHTPSFWGFSTSLHNCKRQPPRNN